MYVFIFLYFKVVGGIKGCFKIVEKDMDIKVSIFLEF